MSPPPGLAPVTACVLFLRSGPAPQAAGPGQGGLRDRLVTLAQAALQDWPAGRRVVLQAGDALAVVGEVAPSQALAAAQRARRQAGGLPLAIALHRGAVSALRDAAGAARVSGPALETAAALAAAGEHGIAASQAFVEALAQEAPRSAEAFRPLANES